MNDHAVTGAVELPIMLSGLVQLLSRFPEQQIQIVYPYNGSEPFTSFRSGNWKVRGSFSWEIAHALIRDTTESQSDGAQIYTAVDHSQRLPEQGFTSLTGDESIG